MSHGRADLTDLTAPQPGPPARGHTVTDGERSSNTLRAYAEIRRRILNNEMPPGSRYLEQELAEALGMSRTPVREALIRLTEERLVDVRPRHGARVLPVSIEDVRQIYELLADLEALAAQRAAERRCSDAALARLEAEMAQMEAATARGDMLGWIQADDRFHRALVLLSGNARLAATVGTLCDQAHTARMQTLKSRPEPSASNADHAAAVAAIRAGDGARASAILRRHRETGGTVLRDILRAMSPTTR